MSQTLTPEMAGSVIGTDGFATVGEAARFLHISRAKLYQVMEDGELTYAKFGRCRRIPWKILREFAEGSMIGNGKN